MNDAPPTAETLNNLLQQQIDIIHDAIGKMKNNEVPSLNDMDSVVASICQNIEKSDPEVAQQTETKMAEMISGLEGLAIALKDFQPPLCDPISGPQPDNENG